MTAILPTTAELYQFYDTPENQENLRDKIIQTRAMQVLARDDLDQLPAQGQRLVQRLHEIGELKREKQEARDKELNRIWFWETLAKVLKLAGAVLASGIAWWASLMPNYSFITSQFIPGAIMVANGVHETYMADKAKHMTEEEYYNKIHGLDNECLVVLAELEPMVRQLDEKE